MTEVILQRCSDGEHRRCRGLVSATVVANCIFCSCSCHEWAATGMAECPKCGAAPFEHFMRGQVRAPFWRGWWRRCVICRNCKRIVGYENAKQG